MNQNDTCENEPCKSLPDYVKKHIKALDIVEGVEENHLTEMTTDAYGEMKFSGLRVLAGVYPKYIRASQTETLNDDLYYIMTRIWNIKEPELIISINGGAKEMIPLSNVQKSAFKTGLINVSKTVSTWIITGGFNTGVSKLVGEAARDYNIVSQDKSFIVLGIGAWGSVHNNKCLVVSNRDENNPKRAIYTNEDDKGIPKSQALLDPNHDVFVLFDAGSENNEIEFRTKFERFVSEKAKCRVVQVIVEGGKKCIQTAKKALEQETPVVVMKGSKRAADLICNVIESNADTKNDTITDWFEKNEKEWSIDAKERISLSENLKCLHESRQKNLVHILSMSDFTKNLGRAILEAAFPVQISDMEHGREASTELTLNINTPVTIGDKQRTNDERLMLAMTFNCPDAAEEWILNRYPSRGPQLSDEIYMENALVKNQWRFVNLFISRGFKLEPFLTEELLKKLYFGEEANKYSNTNTANTINILKHKVRSKDHDKMSTIGMIVKMLTRKVIPNMYIEEKKFTKCCGSNAIEDESIILKLNHADVKGKPKDEKISTKCCGLNAIEDEEEYTIYPPIKGGLRMYTEQDLFIWALLTQRVEMAKIFWEVGKDHIGSALIASVICKSLSKIADKEGEADTMLTLQKYQIEFENLAIDILTKVYLRDKIRTHLLLIRALPYWGGVTCMEIANKCNLINFLSQSACQTRLNIIWRGGVSIYTTKVWFMLNLPFAFLTSKLLIFPSRKIEDNDQQISLKTSLKNGNVDENKAVKDDGKDDSKTTSAKKEDYLTKFRSDQQITLRNVSFCDAVSLYYKAPKTKFSMYIISYLVFLIIYTYMCLVELKPLADVTTDSQRQAEYVMYTYVLSFVLEEIRQFSTDVSLNSVSGKMIGWLSSIWNIYDLLLYLFFLLAVILRHIAYVDFVYSRTLFSVALSMFFLRFLQFFYVNRSIGPKVISVSRMIKDILFFLALYVIAIFAYGTFAQALLFNNRPLDGSLLLNIVFMPYWQSYGDLHIDYVQGQTPVNNVTPTPNAIVIVGFAFFMLFTNALLMNMLVAMFTNTFQKVEDNSNRLWAYNRYVLIEEFYFKPIMPPPINVVEILLRTLKAIVSRVSNPKTKDELLVNLCHDEDLICSGFEQQCVEKYILENPWNTSPGDTDQSESSKRELQSSIDVIEDVMEKLKLEIEKANLKIQTLRDIDRKT